jgi:hypothetical protein
MEISGQLVQQEWWSEANLHWYLQLECTLQQTAGTKQLINIFKA